jgi:ABC-type Fe3+-siderophore transport system permease subunit
VGGRSNFAAHGFVACTGVTALLCSEVLFNYLSFGFDAHWIQYVGFAAGAAIFGYVIYRHLRLNSRASRRRLAIAGAVASVFLYGTTAALQAATESAQQGAQRYDGALKAPLFLLVAGAPPDAFLAAGEELKSKVDAMARLPE